MNTSHNASESARLIDELKHEIQHDQEEIRREEPKRREVEQKIARAKAELAKEEAEGKHIEEHLNMLKTNLMHAEQSFRTMQQELAKALKKN